MLIRRRAVAEPGIIGQIHQKLCAAVDEVPYQVRENDFKANQHAEAPLWNSHDGIVRAMAKVSNAIHQLIEKEQQMAERNVLPKGYQMDLIVTSLHSDIPPYEEGTVIHMIFAVGTDMGRAAEEQRSPHVLHEAQLACLKIAVTGKKERRGRF